MGANSSIKRLHSQEEYYDLDTDSDIYSILGGSSFIFLLAITVFALLFITYVSIEYFKFAIRKIVSKRGILIILLLDI